MWTIAIVSCLAAPLPEGLSLRLMAPKSEVMIGEPVWVQLEVDNQTPSDLHLSLADNLTSRSALRVEVVDSDGVQLPDPWRQRPPATIKPAGQRSVDIVAHSMGRATFDVNRYARFIHPGHYTVRLMFPVATDPGGVFADDDPRWVETALSVRLPSADEAAALLDRLDSPQELLGPDGVRYLFDGLGHPIYVPLLTELARHLQTDPIQVETRAMVGLRSCPCREATDAMLTLHRQLDVMTVRTQLHDGLLERLEFAEPAQVDQILVLAREALAAPIESPEWGAHYQFGANVMARVGTAADAEILAQAASRALHATITPNVTNQRHGVLQMLLPAMRWPDAQTADPRVRSLIALAEFPGWGSEPPQGWAEVVLAAVRTGHPDLVALALRRFDQPAAPELRAAISESLLIDDPWVRTRGLSYVGRYPHPDYHDVLLALIDRVEPRQAVAVAHVSRRHNLHWDRVLERLLSRIERQGDPDGSLVLACLGPTIAPRVYASRRVPAAELPGLISAWRGFIAAHRERLRGEPLVAGEPELPAELVPSTWHFTLADGSSWPAR